MLIPTKIITTIKHKSKILIKQINYKALKMQVSFWNNQFLINRTDSIYGANGTFWVSGNDVYIEDPLQNGDIVEIETNQFTQVQEITQNTVAEFVNFGQAVEICSYNCSFRRAGNTNSSSIWITIAVAVAIAIPAERENQHKSDSILITFASVVAVAVPAERETNRVEF